MKPIFFPSCEAFRNWLEENHQSQTELWVGFFKVSSGKPSMSWSQSVDQALCFGWIDGVRKSIDHERYCIRFTPRKASSNWSTVNINKVEELSSKGLMQPQGLNVFNSRKIDNFQQYSYENKPERFSDSYEKQFRSNKKAWAFFEMQAPSYQKTVCFWVMSAKQEATRLRRLDKAIDASEAGQRIF
jgi:uncharacterized protein YdeI (YjbR/CyaY-like superfamily)